MTGRCVDLGGREDGITLAMLGAGSGLPRDLLAVTAEKAAWLQSR
jgi:hypothetical protein